MINRFLDLVKPLILRINRRKAFMKGSSHFVLMRQNYSKVKDLNEVEFKIFSQSFITV